MVEKHLKKCSAILELVFQTQDSEDLCAEQEPRKLSDENARGMLGGCVGPNQDLFYLENF